jgi:hypothetical protein
MADEESAPKKAAEPLVHLRRARPEEVAAGSPRRVPMTEEEYEAACRAFDRYSGAARGGCWEWMT